MAQEKLISKSNIRWFWRFFVKEHFIFLFCALIFMSLEGSMLGLLSYSIKFLFDDVLVSQETENIFLVGVIVFSIFSVRAIAGFAHRVITINVAQKIIKKLQDEMVVHLVNLDLSFHKINPPGKLMDRVRADSKALSDSVGEAFMTAGRDGFSLISLVLVVFFIDWQWAIIAFLGTPILVLPIIFLQKWVRGKAGENRDSETQANVRLDEIFHGVSDIKLNQAENTERKRFLSILNSTHKIRLKLESGMAGIPALIDIIAAIGFLAVMVFGAIDIVSGSKTIGEFMSFFTAMALIFEPLRRLSNVSGNLQVAIASLDRVKNVFETRPSIMTPRLPVRKPIIKRDIGVQFKNVCFSYDKIKAVQNINFDISPGTTSAFVGVSGSGKTTLFNLITRIIDPDDGSILINGTDIKEIDLYHLRSLFSVVKQDGMIFDDTILENIRFGKQSASVTEIKRAAKMAYVDEFADNMKEGLNSRVGSRGSALSGGQRQRIAIARAFLRDSPLLLLDEPTSALDNQSEKLIQKSLAALSEKCTTLVVAHRLSTIVASDNIFVLEGGKLVESGSHENLLNKGKFYPKLFNSERKERVRKSG